METTRIQAGTYTHKYPETEIKLKRQGTLTHRNTHRNLDQIIAERFWELLEEKNMAKKAYAEQWEKHKLLSNRMFLLSKIREFGFYSALEQTHGEERMFVEQFAVTKREIIDQKYQDYAEQQKQSFKELLKLQELTKG